MEQGGHGGDGGGCGWGEATKGPDGALAHGSLGIGQYGAESLFGMGFCTMGEQVAEGFRGMGPGRCPGLGI
jgi:hypothetical protein